MSWIDYLNLIDSKERFEKELLLYNSLFPLDNLSMKNIYQTKIDYLTTKIASISTKDFSKTA